MSKETDFHFHLRQDAPAYQLVRNGREHQFRNDASAISFFNHIDLGAGSLHYKAVRQIDLLADKLLRQGIMYYTAEDKVRGIFPKVDFLGSVSADGDHPIPQEKPMLQSHVWRCADAKIDLILCDHVFDFQGRSFQQFHPYTGELLFEYGQDAGEDQRCAERHRGHPNDALHQMILRISPLIQLVFKIDHFIRKRKDILPRVCQEQLAPLTADKQSDAQFLLQLLDPMADGWL